MTDAPRGPEPRRHHAVPRLLLKGFAVERKRGRFQTQVFDKQTDRTYASPIEDVMVERDFNAMEIDGRRVSLEDHVGQLESLAAPLIDRVIREASVASLTQAERLELARFVALQFIRGTGQRALFDDGAKQMAAEIKRRGVPLAEELDFTPDEVKAYGLLSIGKDLPEYAAHMALKDMILHCAPKGAEFILGDNPVALDNQEPAGFWGSMGLASKGIQIYLPLNSEFCLGLWCPSLRERFMESFRASRARLGTVKAQAVLGANPVKIPAEMIRQADAALARLAPIERSFTAGEALRLDAENVIHLNALQVMYAERFVISRSGNFDLVRRMLADSDGFRQGRRMKVG